jgi:hypothetical protein
MMGRRRSERTLKARLWVLVLSLASAILSGCHSKKSDESTQSASSVLACLKTQQIKGEYRSVSQCITTGPAETMSGTWVRSFETSWYLDGNVDVIDISNRRSIPSLLFKQMPLKADGPTNDRRAFRVRFVGRKTVSGALVSAVLVDRLLSIQPVDAPSIIRSK